MKLLTCAGDRIKMPFLDDSRDRLKSFVYAIQNQIPPLLLAIAFYFALVSIRFYLLGRFGSDLPYSDQWDAEGWELLRPYKTGSIDWHMLFMPQNEHRIALFRILVLALFVMNNAQWDNLVSSAFDVLFVALLATLVFYSLRKYTGCSRLVTRAFLAGACVLPFGYENLLVGFQASFYFLIALAILGIWVAASFRRSLYFTVVAGTIAYLSLFTIASGIFTPLVMIFAVLLNTWMRREGWAGCLLPVLVLTSAVAVGYYLLTPMLGNDALHARGFFEWLMCVRNLASWPLPNSWLSVVLIWCPAVVIGLRMLTKRSGDTSVIVGLSLSIWTTAQIVSIAFGRGHEMHEIHSRYTDVLAVGVVANAFLCTLAVEFGNNKTANRRLATLLFSTWLLIVGGAFVARGAMAVKLMQQFASMRSAQVQNVRLYMTGLHPLALEKAPPWNLPFPDYKRLQMMLNDSVIRKMLPPSVRVPLNLGPSQNGFSSDGLPAGVTGSSIYGTYGSYSNPIGNANRGDFRISGLHVDMPYLRFPVAGTLATPDTGLLLSASRTPIHIIVNAHWHHPGKWENVIVRVPAKDFSFHAWDHSTSSWIAFGRPVEMGRLSALTSKAIALSPFVIVSTCLATGLFALLLGLGRFRLPSRFKFDWIWKRRKS